MRRTRHVVLPVRSWQYIGLLLVSLACVTFGLVSRDREGRAGSLVGPELMHRAPHNVDACPNSNPFVSLPIGTGLEEAQVPVPSSDVEESIHVELTRSTSRNERAITRSTCILERKPADSRIQVLAKRESKMDDGLRKGERFVSTRMGTRNSSLRRLEGRVDRQRRAYVRSFDPSNARLTTMKRLTNEHRESKTENGVPVEFESRKSRGISTRRTTHRKDLVENGKSQLVVRDRKQNEVRSDSDNFERREKRDTRDRLRQTEFRDRKARSVEIRRIVLGKKNTRQARERSEDNFADRRQRVHELRRRIVRDDRLERRQVEIRERRSRSLEPRTLEDRSKRQTRDNIGDLSLERRQDRRNVHEAERRNAQNNRIERRQAEIRERRSRSVEPRTLEDRSTRQTRNNVKDLSLERRQDRRSIYEAERRSVQNNRRETEIRERRTRSVEPRTFEDKNRRQNRDNIKNLSLERRQDRRNVYEAERRSVQNNRIERRQAEIRERRSRSVEPRTLEDRSTRQTRNNVKDLFLERQQDQRQDRRQDRRNVYETERRNAQNNRLERSQAEIRERRSRSLEPRTLEDRSRRQTRDNIKDLSVERRQDRRSIYEAERRSVQNNRIERRQAEIRERRSQSVEPRSLEDRSKRQSRANIKDLSLERRQDRRNVNEAERRSIQNNRIERRQAKIRERRSRSVEPRTLEDRTRQQTRDNIKDLSLERRQDRGSVHGAERRNAQNNRIERRQAEIRERRSRSVEPRSLEDRSKRQSRANIKDLSLERRQDRRNVYEAERRSVQNNRIEQRQAEIRERKSRSVESKTLEDRSKRQIRDNLNVRLLERRQNQRNVQNNRVERREAEIRGRSSRSVESRSLEDKSRRQSRDNIENLSLERRQDRRSIYEAERRSVQNNRVERRQAEIREHNSRSVEPRTLKYRSARQFRDNLSVRLLERRQDQRSVHEIESRSVQNNRVERRQAEDRERRSRSVEPKALEDKNRRQIRDNLMVRSLERRQDRRNVHEAERRNVQNNRLERRQAEIRELRSRLFTERRDLSRNNPHRFQRQLATSGTTESLVTRRLTDFPDRMPLDHNRFIERRERIERREIGRTNDRRLFHDSSYDRKSVERDRSKLKHSSSGDNNRRNDRNSLRRLYVLDRIEKSQGRALYARSTESIDVSRLGKDDKLQRIDVAQRFNSRQTRSKIGNWESEARQERHEFDASRREVFDVRTNYDRRNVARSSVSRGSRNEYTRANNAKQSQVRRVDDTSGQMKSRSIVPGPRNERTTRMALTRIEKNAVRSNSLRDDSKISRRSVRSLEIPNFIERYGSFVRSQNRALSPRNEIAKKFENDDSSRETVRNVRSITYGDIPTFARDNYPEKRRVIIGMDRRLARKIRDLRVTRFKAASELIPKFLEIDNTLEYRLALDIIRQAAIIALCTIYGMSVYKGKGFFMSDLFRHLNRFVAW